jgi:hypothetical protein
LVVLIIAVTLLAAASISDMVAHSSTDALVARWFHETVPGPGEQSSTLAEEP